MGKKTPLILASGSPRRAELLRQVGVSFEVLLPHVNETGQQEGNDVAALSREIALEKAKAVSRCRPESIVVGADTLVVCDGELLGKPATREEAARMLRKLSGRDHYVVTGVALCRSEAGELELATDSERTVVTFKRLEEDEIASYVASGEPFDKAGGYGIQGKAALLVERIVGSYSNVVGLPLGLLYAMLRRWDYEVLG